MRPPPLKRQLWTQTPINSPDLCIRPLPNHHGARQAVAQLTNFFNCGTIAGVGENGFQL